MALDSLNSALDPRRAMQAYGEQAQRFERLRPQAPVVQSQPTSEQNQQASRGFSFSLGKLGVRYEEQEQETTLDTQQLARMALERVQREQDAAFRAEMEVEELKSALALPSQAEGADQGSLLSQDPPRHLQNAAQRAYEDHERVYRSAAYRPGIFLGVV